MSNHDAEPSGPNLFTPGDLLWFGPSPIHGTGAFARVLIPAGTRVLEYLGTRVNSQECLARCAGHNEFLFSLGENEALDGDVPWNPARFLNHNCAPNCEAVFEHGRIWFVAIRGILAGEELTFNYGYDLEDYRSYPCRCGSPSCVGYIVAEVFFQHVRKRTLTCADSGAPIRD